MRAARWAALAAACLAGAARAQPPGEPATKLARRALEALERKDRAAFWRCLPRTPEPGFEKVYRSLWEVFAKPGRELELAVTGRARRNRDRAIVEFRARKARAAREPERLWMWIRAEQGAWRLWFVDPDPRAARAWLYEEGKVATSPSARLAATIWLEAASEGDAAGAERVCAHQLWEGPREGIRPLFELIGRKEIRARLAECTERDSRAAARIVLAAKARPGRQTTVHLLLAARAGRWLVAGFTPKAERATAFLEGRAGAYPWPRSPHALANAVCEAIAGWRTFALRRLALPGARAELVRFCADVHERGARPRAGEATTREDRAAAPVTLLETRKDGEPAVAGEVVLLCVRTLEGWRVAGGADDEDAVAAFLKGK